MVGTTLGAYRIDAEIGRGGMGQVYRAHDTALNRTVAIKVLPDGLASDPDRLARFEREAQALAALNHPNIAHIYGLEKSGPTPAIVMEFIGGEDLSVRIKRGPLPLAEALPLARQLADALDAAHEAGIIHRDLKPANIKVTDAGTVKVLDFGLAKALDTTPGTTETANSPTLTNRATQLGIILGTAAYMAPEQARGKTVDKRADIWAFGVVLYEMLTGIRPFDGDDVTDILAAVVRAEPDWATLPKDTPPLIRRLLQRCLMKDPKQRLHDVADALLEIEETLNPKLAALAEVSAGPVVSRKRILAWVLAFVGVALVSSVAGVLIDRMLSGGRSSGVSTVVSFSLTPPPGWTLGLGGGTLMQTSRPQMAVSPDGSKVVFRAHMPGTGLLYLRSVASAGVEPIKGTEGANFPSWSPDGTRIAFCQGGELKQISVSGGPTQVVGPCANPRSAAAWGNGDMFLAAGSYSGPLQARIGGEWRDVLASVRRTEGCYYLTPQWLPDGQHYLVAKWSSSVDPKAHSCEGLYVGSLTSQTPVALLPGSVEGVAIVNGGIIFLRGGELTWQGFDFVRRALIGPSQVIANDVVTFSAGGHAVAYAARTGVKPHRFSVGNRLAWYERDGSGPTFTGGPGTYGDPSISPDDRALLVSQVEGTGRSRAVVFDLRSNAPNPLGSSGFGVWSPDAQRVALWGATGITVLGLADGQERLLTRPDGQTPGTAFDWTLDGKWLMTTGIRALSMIDNTEFSVGNASGGDDAALSPDQKWLAFDLNSRIYVVPFPGPGPRIPVSPLDGTTPRWRGDGRELYFARVGGEQAIVAVPVSSSGPTPVFGQAQVLFKARALARNWAFDVTRDGKRFVMVVAAEPDPVTLTVQVGGFGNKK